MRRLFIPKACCLALLTCVAGCGLFEGAGGLSCNEIGCTDDLTVHFEEPDGTAATNLEGSVGETTFECPGEVGGPASKCKEGTIRVTDINPGEPVGIDVEATDGESRYVFQETIEPEYETVRPNGPDCPPACEQAETTVTMEER